MRIFLSISLVFSDLGLQFGTMSVHLICMPSFVQVLLYKLFLQHFCSYSLKFPIFQILRGYMYVSFFFFKYFLQKSTSHRSTFKQIRVKNRGFFLEIFCKYFVAVRKMHIFLRIIFQNNFFLKKIVIVFRTFF